MKSLVYFSPSLCTTGSWSGGLRQKRKRLLLLFGASTTWSRSLSPVKSWGRSWQGRSRYLYEHVSPRSQAELKTSDRDGVGKDLKQRLRLLCWSGPSSDVILGMWGCDVIHVYCFREMFYSYQWSILFVRFNCLRASVTLTSIIFMWRYLILLHLKFSLFNMFILVCKDWSKFFLKRGLTSWNQIFDSLNRSESLIYRICQWPSSVISDLDVLEDVHYR